MNWSIFVLGEGMRNRVFSQVIGIPMGSDATPFFADLYLHYYNSRWNYGFVKEIRYLTSYNQILDLLINLLVVEKGHG